ncbi:MAG: hypothetical protein M3362_19435, partial [Acidobacteriota bacterium]|nr:hypothetical protein [Acidobacteriota bacterium]
MSDEFKTGFYSSLITYVSLPTIVPPVGINLITASNPSEAAGGHEELDFVSFNRDIMRTQWTLALLAALAFLFLAATSATVRAQILNEPPPPPPKPKPQPTPKDEDYEVMRVTSNLVVVPVSVTDTAGQPVLGLKLSDFHLEEEGHAQEVTQMGDPEQTPLDIAILLDVSGSVESRFTFEQQAAASFLRQVLKPGDRA